MYGFSATLTHDSHDHFDVYLRYPLPELCKDIGLIILVTV